MTLIVIGVCSRSLKRLDVRFRFSAESAVPHVGLEPARIGMRFEEDLVETPKNPEVSRLSRREAIQVGAGALLGSAAILAGAGEMTKLSAQGPAPVQATPLACNRPEIPDAARLESGTEAIGAKHLRVYTRRWARCQRRRRFESRHDCRLRLLDGH